MGGGSQLRDPGCWNVGCFRGFMTLVTAVLRSAGSNCSRRRETQAVPLARKSPLLPSCSRGVSVHLDEDLCIQGQHSQAKPQTPAHYQVSFARAAGKSQSPGWDLRWPRETLCGLQPLELRAVDVRGWGRLVMGQGLSSELEDAGPVADPSPRCDHRKCLLTLPPRGRTCLY